jgi:hypothetical protein
MPSPNLPPDVDRPAPARRLMGTPLVLPVWTHGMAPVAEQPGTGFTVDGKPAAAWVPHVVSASKYTYSGVLVSEVELKTDAAWVVTTFKGEPDNSSVIKPVTGWSPAAKIGQIATQRNGTSVTFSAQVSGVPSGGAQLLFVPYAPSFPAVADHAAYQALGAAEDLAAGDHPTVKRTVTAGAVTRYALVLARGFPKATEVLSAARLVQV